MTCFGITNDTQDEKTFKVVLPETATPFTYYTDNNCSVIGGNMVSQTNVQAGETIYYDKLPSTVYTFGHKSTMYGDVYNTCTLQNNHYTNSNHYTKSKHHRLELSNCNSDYYHEESYANPS